MGKSRGSWFATIKRAFMSPAQKRICGRRYDISPEEHKGRVRKRFPEQTINITTRPDDSPLDDAFAAAIATTAAAEAAVASAKAALEAYHPSAYLRDHRAATTVQAAFRGYLARRALSALKGLVKLQALVRGQNVRRQAEMTLRSVQAMVRVQVQMRDQRASHLFLNLRRASPEQHIEEEWMARKQRWSPSRSSFDQRDAIKTIEIDTYRPYSVSASTVPHYMSATESTKARVRSQSAPRRNAMTPERDGLRGTKKMFCSPIHHPSVYKISLGRLLDEDQESDAYTTKRML